MNWLLPITLQCLAIFSLIQARVEPRRRSTENDKDLFEEFIKKYSKNYEVAEYEERFQIFQKNLDRIHELNADLEYPVHGVNIFSDMTFEEFKIRFGLVADDELSIPEDHKCIEITIDSLYSLDKLVIPRELDWRKHNLVTAVSNQGHCGSCWAFSTIGNIEGQLARAFGALMPLSKQQLFDCTKYATCNIGYNTYYALRDLIDNEVGLVTEYDYPYWSGAPYVGKLDHCPSFGDNQLKVKIDNCEVYKLYDNEQALKRALFLRGPLAVGIKATALFHLNETHYVNEVLCEKYHNEERDGHAVLLVGYGQENGEEYWLLKNSWGEQWGDKGYFRMKLGVNCLRMLNQPIVSSLIYYKGINTQKYD